MTAAPKSTTPFKPDTRTDEGPNAKQIGGGHYRSQYQHWDLIEEHGLGYLEGNITKYITRWRKKAGLQDLEKALHYGEKLYELAKDHGRKARGMVQTSYLETYADANDLSAMEYELVSLYCRWQMPADLAHANKLLKRFAAEAKLYASSRSDNTGMKHPRGFDPEQDAAPTPDEE